MVSSRKPNLTGKNYTKNNFHLPSSQLYLRNSPTKSCSKTFDLPSSKTTLKKSTSGLLEVGVSNAKISIEKMPYSS